MTERPKHTPRDNPPQLPSAAAAKYPLLAKADTKFHILGDFINGIDPNQKSVAPYATLWWHCRPFHSSCWQRHAIAMDRRAGKAHPTRLQQYDSSQPCGSVSFVPCENRGASGIGEHMPLEVIKNDGGYLTVRASGTLTREDYQSSLSDVSSALHAHRGDPVLLDWSTLQGWADDSDEAYAFHAWLELGRLPGRLAILSSKQAGEQLAWFLELARAQDIKAEAFETSEQDDAVAWLLGKD